MALIRLDRYLSNQAGLTRSQAREALKSKRVCVNGKTEKDFDFRIDPNTDHVKLDDNDISYSEFIYIMMNKPAGVLTATEDKTRKTVLDLVPPIFRRKNLAPVGRLDKDTTGLLLLTDDGVFAHRIISPKSDIEKEYIVHLDGDITNEHIEVFAKGVVLADGTRCMPAVMKRLDKNKASVIIKEGKYHQIKRMFGTIGLGVNALARVRIASLALPDDLEFGAVVPIDATQFFEQIVYN